MWDKTDLDHHFAGTFNILGEEIPGEIIFNKGNGVTLISLLKIFPEGPSLGKTYHKIDAITGVLNTGALITLFHNRCITNQTINLHTQKIVFKSEYSIWSHSDTTDAKYNRFVFELENALSWSGLSVLDTSDSSIIRINDKREECEKVYHWFGATITFLTSINCELFCYPRKEEAKVVEHLVVQIDMDEKQDVSSFLTIRNRVISLISFAIKDNVNIEKQYLIDLDDGQQTGDQFIHYKHYLRTSDRRLYIQNTQLWNGNFTLGQLLPEKNIQNELNLLEPVFNLYLSLFKYSDMPAEMVFLNIVQALETFHARFFYDDKDEYVESVKNRFGSMANYSDIEKLLLCDTQKDKNCKYIILVSRLNDLLIGKYDGMFIEYYANDVGFAQAVADTRHYYTHYGKSKENKALKGDQLIEAIRVLTILLDYNVCLKLGIDNRERVKQQLGNIQSWRQFQTDEQKTKT